MKKTIAVLAIFMLMLGLDCVGAFGDMITYDFGDFTMDFDDGTLGQIGEKAEGQTLFMLYPEYEESDIFHDNINAVWMEGYEDITTYDVDQFAEETLLSIVKQFEAMNIAVENPTVISASLGEQDGKTAIALVMSSDLDYTGAGIDLKATLYTLEAIFSDEAFGTYVFTISTDDLQSCGATVDILDSIRFAK